MKPSFRDKKDSLSYAQLSLWYETLHRIEDNSYLLFARIRSRVPFSPSRLDQTLKTLAERHPQLLMRIEADGPSVVQSYCEYPGIRICSGGEEREAETIQHFSLEDRPLFRIFLIPGSDFSDLVLTWHHLAGDAWSFGILFKDFKALYFGERDLLPLRSSYGDFIRFQEEWISGPYGRMGAAYWKKELQDLVPLRGLCSVSGGCRTGKITSGVRRIPVSLPSRREYTSFELMLAAYCFLLSDYSGREDVPVLVPLHGRPRKDFYNVFGHFVNPALIRVNLAGLESFRELLEAVRIKLHRALEWQNYPFLLVAEAFAVPGNHASAPFTEAFCGMVRLPRGLSFGEEDGSPLELLDLRQTGSPRQLSLELCEGDGFCYMELRYPEELWDASTVDALSAAMEAILKVTVEDPGIRIADLPRLPRQIHINSPLPDPDFFHESRGADSYVAPRTLCEKALVEIWESVLNCERIGIDDDFFSLGGHSLRATQVMTRVAERFLVRLPLGTLFQVKTVRGLARILDTEQHGPEQKNLLLSGMVPPGDRGPLSFSQERMWFIHQLEPESAAYNINVALRLRGPLWPDKLQRAFRSLQERHEILRTTFHESEGTPFQVVHPAPLADLSVADLSGTATDRRIALARTIAETEASRPFDLQQGPLIRIQVLRLDEGDQVLILSLHHIIGDQWSLGVISRELTALYRSETPAPLLVQYRDYVVWQREEFTDHHRAEDLRFWKESLQSVPVIELPADRPRPPIQTYRGGAIRVALTETEQRRIRRISLDLNVTSYMLMLAVFAVLLKRLSGSSEIPIGTPVANRMHPAFEELIGTFVNTLVLRIPVDEDQKFSGFLVRIRETVLEAFEHQNYPFEKLVEALNPERDISRLPLTQVLFNMVNTPQEAPFGNEFEWEIFPLEHAGVQFDLSLSVDLEISGEILLQYNEDLFLSETGEKLLQMYRKLLGAILENPENRTADLPLMSRLELEKVLVRRNSTWRDYPLDVPLTDFLFKRAEEFFTSTALKHGAERFSYGRLFTEAGKLANLLYSRKIGEGSLVGIYMQRSPRLIISLLGIAASGAAYLPLDTGYPDARLEFMLKQSGAEVLLTESSLSGNLEFHGGTILEWEDLEPLFPGFDGSPPALCPDSERLLYVLYTSGSTGDPKGVEIPNRAFVNFLFSMSDSPGFSCEDGLLAVTPVSFDISGLEIYLPLFTGGTLILTDRDTAADPLLLKEALADPAVTVMQATPSTWRMLLEAGWKGPLKTLLCGGEAFPPDLLNPLLAVSENLWNMYGPTETTVWSTLQRLYPGANPIPVGRPVANTSVYLLDELMRPVPDGVQGELHIGGAGLSLGYRKRPDLTRGAFVPHPFAEGESLYRTGDLVRVLPDGSLVCLGRRDNQIKLNGHRIELGEVEDRLSRHPGIAQAVCRILEYGPGDSRLAAYCIPASREEGLPDSAVLRDYLEEMLPGYMIPGLWIPMESFPLTDNGKIDRLRLPFKSADISRGREGPEGERALSETELKVYSIWQRLLKTGVFGVDDDFFALGGHSLMAVSLVAAVRREFGVELPLRLFFTQPTVRGTARRLEELRGKSTETPVENDVLFVMQRYGSLPPLFIIAGVYAQEDGLYRFLSSLVPHIGSNQPVYGLRPRGLMHPAPQYSSIEEMAAEYLTQVRALRPEGPYWLVGECIGGVVAYEMARRLIQDHEEVCLVMLDTEYPSRLRRLRYLFLYYAGRLRDKMLRTFNMAIKKPLETPGRLLAFLRFRYRAAFPRTDQEKTLTRFRRVERHYSRLVYSYPFPYLTGTAHLLINEEDSHYLRDLGWLSSGRSHGKTGPRELIITKVPGNHISRITRYGSELGREIRNILDKSSPEDPEKGS
ncbi:non-ribosomal peptide synthetase [Marispirochaeta aestuarii]|uniref:non-ribosomal peptide synthetase n=1 Tax=Marispirochaeta aestuarii TaxID=1963862 RepID=UPI002ABE5BE0|nr:non-ribosomal peptide synthetase [Marispirochaeta aestuarii]